MPEKEIIELRKVLYSLNESELVLNNEQKLLGIVIYHKKNYHRGRIRFRHLKEVQRKLKQIRISFTHLMDKMKQCCQLNKLKNYPHLIDLLDSNGKNINYFMDIIIKCLNSFIEEYLISFHDMQFCYLVIGILGRFYVLYLYYLNKMEHIRWMLYNKYHNTNINDTIYWNDFNTNQFMFPHKIFKYGNYFKYNEWIKISNNNTDNIHEIIQKFNKYFNTNISAFETDIIQNNDDIKMDIPTNKDITKNHKKSVSPNVGKKRKRDETKLQNKPKKQKLIPKKKSDKKEPALTVLTNKDTNDNATQNETDFIDDIFADLD